MKYRLRLGAVTIPVKSILMALFFVFFILKMQRAFSGSSVQGGVWNYIQLLFAALGLLLFAMKIRRYLDAPLVVFFFLYTILALVNSLFYVELSRTWFFQYLTIAYAFSVLVIAMEAGRYSDIEKNPLMVAAFLLMAVFYVWSMARHGAYSTRTGAVADVYYVLCLLPLMMICFRKYQMIPLFLCGVAILISGKRTGIIVYAMMVFVYYLLISIQSHSVWTYLKSVLKLLLFAVAFVFMLRLVNSAFNTHLLTRLTRIITENDSSGRYERWKQILRSFQNTNLRHWITGFGNGAVSKRFSGNAHNDFLEILYDYGVFAVLFYGLFYVAWAGELLQMLRDGYEYAPQFAMCIMVSLGLASFSFYAIAPTYVTAGMLCAGFIWSDYHKRMDPNSPPSALEN